MNVNTAQLFSVKKLTWTFTTIALICAIGSALSFKRIKQIDAFNQAVMAGKPVDTDKDSFEKSFSEALSLAKKNDTKKH